MLTRFTVPKRMELISDSGRFSFLLTTGYFDRVWKGADESRGSEPERTERWRRLAAGAQLFGAVAPAQGRSRAAGRCCRRRRRRPRAPSAARIDADLR